MATNKKITFQGADGGLLQTMERIKRQSEEMYNRTITQAKKVSESGREQLAFIEMQAKALERKNAQLERERKILNETHRENILAINREQMAGRISPAQAQQQRRDLINERGQRISDIDVQSSQNTETSSLLRELIETVKLTAREEIAEDRKDVERGIREEDRLRRRGRVDEIRDEEALVTGVQRDMIGSSGDKSIFKDVLLANLVTEGLKGIFKGVSNVVNTTMNAQEGSEMLLPQIISQFSPLGLPIGNLIAQPYMRHLDAQFGLNKASGLNIATGGRAINTGSLSALGYTLEESQGVARDIMLARGTNRGVGGRTRDALSLERGMGLDRGVIMQMFRDMRMTGDQMDIVRNTASVLNTMGVDMSDRVLMGELLQTQSNLIQQQGQAVQTVNRGAITSMMGAFGGLGGRFQQDPQFLQRTLSQVNSAFVQPQNEFAQARQFGVLSQLNPNASYFQLLEMQEKGIFQSGLLGGTLSSLQREMGQDPEAMMVAFKQMTGLGAETTRNIIQGYLLDPDRFKGFQGSEQEAMEMLGVSPSRLRAEAGRDDILPERIRSMAEVQDAFVTGGIEGMKTLGKQLGEDIVEQIKKADFNINIFGVKVGTDSLSELLEKKTK